MRVPYFHQQRLCKQQRLARQFKGDDSGTTLVEFAVVLPLFLLFFFAMVDFGRMGFEYVLANKAVQIAARTAIVRPPACAGVPTINTRGAVAINTVPPAFGTDCRAGLTVCAAPAVVQCTGNVANTTVAEVWTKVSKLMPTGSTVANLSFSYEYTPTLGFLGGPYVPMVTVEITDFDFQFITPLAALAAVAGGTAVSGSTAPGSVQFPDLGVTLPAEDLALGEAG
jgi:Flp pilus assembly protein TadG